MRPKMLALFTTLCFLAGTAWLFFSILLKTGGHFTYTLDDPYIHLALSQRILHGLYGLNLGEPTSSSSSLIWPFLFVPFAGTWIFEFMPLLLNLAFGAATAWLLGFTVAKLDDFQASPVSRWRGPLVAVLLLFATNLFGLVFTGLEHSLQVLLCVCCAYGILQLQWDGRISAVPLCAAALLPSVRYEGVLILFAVACALWGAQHRRQALALVAYGMAPLVLFALFLKHLHLPFLPMSVLVKGSAGATGAATTVNTHSSSAIVARLMANFSQTERFVEFALLLALIALTYRLRRSTGIAIALAGVTLSAAAQVVAGPYGWFYRYEMYSIAFAAPIVIAGLLNTSALFPSRGEVTATGGRPQIPALLLLAVAAAAGYYTIPFYQTPFAATSIYLQQAQMARFAGEFYKGPVAVNDLGLVAFKRDQAHYVLDLAGLGSYQVFQIRRKDRTSAWMDPVGTEHGIELAMIYPDWFASLPPTWHPVGLLCLQYLRYGAANRNVVFYSTSLTDTRLLQEQITRFKQTVPAGATMDLVGDHSSLTCPD